MKTIACLRVSKDSQDVENQRLEILELANARNLGQVDFVEEVVSSRKDWRERRLGQVLDDLKAGDCVLVAELSRLGRSMFEIMTILHVCVERQIKVYASKGDWALNGNLQSKIVAMVLAMAAEIERDLISQRTKAALDTKKALLHQQGSFISKAGNVVTSLGRPKGPGKSKLDEHHIDILELLELGVKRNRVAERYHTTPANLRHWLKKRNITINPNEKRNDNADKN